MPKCVLMMAASFGAIIQLSAESNYATPYAFTTLAGYATVGGADGSSGTAQFNNPRGVAMDTAGNIYAADSAGCTIRKITPAGVVTTLAGTTGMAGSADGTGSAARFNFPWGVAVDGVGNVYVADYNNSTIRKITSAGVVTTLAGAAGVVGSTDGAGSVARFSGPSGVAVDGAGNVYVTDTFNLTIRKITPGGIVTTFAGTAGSEGSANGTGSAARFSTPWGLAIDGAGNLYIADSGNSIIRKITTGGVVTTLAGTAGSIGSNDGTGSAARFLIPNGVVADGAGNIYVADTLGQKIRKITAAGVVTSVAGASSGNSDGTGTAAQFDNPNGIAVDAAGILYIADSGNSLIRKITATGVVTTFAGVRPGAVESSGTVARFSDPSGVVSDGLGHTYVCDTGNNTIRVISDSGTTSLFAGAVGVIGSANGATSVARFNSPSGLAMDKAGNIYVADTGNSTIRKITGGMITTLAGTAGNQGSADGTGGAAQFQRPEGVAVDKNGNVYVADTGNQTIRKIDAGGTVTTLAGVALSIGYVDGAGAAAKFNFPRGVAVNDAGEVYVADTYNCAIRKISPDGIVTTFAGGTNGSADGTGVGAQFTFPSSISIDATGNVYVADTYNSEIRKISPDGVVTTLAGVAGHAGSTDGTGSGVGFALPRGVTVDGQGNVYVADSGSNTIRKGRRAKTSAVITLDHLGAIYDGSPKVVTATTVPASLAVTLTYDGSATAPVNAGTYAVIGTIDDPNFQGSVSAALQIQKANATLTWHLPATILYGTVLGDAQLNAVATVPGVFTYVPGAGQLLSVGTHNLTASFTPTDTANYNSTATSLSLEVVPTVAPVITGQPASQTLPVGFGVLFSAAATGLPAPTYQWQKNGLDIAGATNSSYSIGAIGAGDAGYYRVLVANVAGSIASDAAILVMGPAQVGPITNNADFDGDGQSDLFWQNTVTGERSFWLMNGTTLKLGVSLGTFAPDWTIVGSGDFNHDGQADLLWQNTITGERTIWLMNGTALSLGVNIGTYSTDIRIMGSGDFNGDGETDIVVQNTITGEATVWLMNGTTKTSEVSLGIMPTAWSIAGTGDFNGDGKMDLVWQNAATGERSVWLMNGTTKSSEVSLGIVPKEQQIVGTGDYNHDGKTDLVWTNTQTGERTIWLMNGLVPINKVIFTLLSVEWSLGRPIFVTAQTAHADFNADGQTDVIWQNSATGEKSLSFLNGATITTTTSLVTTASNWVISGTGDFNHDDKPDLVWTNTTTGERTVWLMDGTTMLSNVPLTTVSPVWAISAIGDFNYDGKPDLVWTNTVTGERAIWLMNGTVFGSGISLGTLSKAWKIATTADLNGDGKTDLIWQNTSTGECSVWLMNGGALASGVALDTLPVQWSIVGSGDFNGDGKADLLLQNTVTGERAVRLMNRTTYLSTVSLGTFGTNLLIRN